MNYSVKNNPNGHQRPRSINLFAENEGIRTMFGRIIINMRQTLALSIILCPACNGSLYRDRSTGRINDRQYAETLKHYGWCVTMQLNMKYRMRVAAEARVRLPRDLSHAATPPAVMVRGSHEETSSSPTRVCQHARRGRCPTCDVILSNECIPR
jgi:hypothetical protein